MNSPTKTIEELREALKKGEYEQPKIKKLAKMRFPLDIIETGRETKVCRQCSSCHNCR